MSDESKTPETDASAHALTIEHGIALLKPHPNGRWVPIEVARRLEVELDQLRAEVERLKAEGNERLPAFMRMTDWKARAERAESQLAARDEALKVAGKQLGYYVHLSHSHPHLVHEGAFTALRRIEELTKA